MNTDPQLSEFFTAGGTLPPDAPSYVTRPTDDELFRHIMAGEFCYVLTPRQMGKSSLMIRTAKRLSSEGVKSAVVDLTQIGTVESEDQWYKGILTQIRRRLRLTVDPVLWWEERKDIPNIQKFIEFFEEALVEIKQHVVIFMDEIDTTLKLDFRDNFFAGIRAFFNARAENPDLKRLTFVLLGVASPSDLIKDRSRTPFNIGQEVLLRPFIRKDALLLEKGLEEKYPGFGRKILDRIFYWTNGHPYLTQKLCQSVVESQWDQYGDRQIDLLVENLFASEEASRETNLQFVRDNIMTSPQRKEVLLVYRNILLGRKERDNKNSLAQNQLKLSGLAIVENGMLVIGNKIYGKVFDKNWVNKHTETNWLVITSVVLGLIVLALGFVIYNDAMALPNRSRDNINNLSIYKDDRGIQYLADLFRMDPFIFPNEYEYKAKDTFFNTFSWDEQRALIEIGYGEPHPPPEDYVVVVSGLYTSLADVDQSGQTTKLLEVIRESLKQMQLQDESLYAEIEHWITARSKFSSNDFQGALEEYNQAVGFNNQNPATLFERARTYIQLEEYENALMDYEQVVAIVPVSNMEPTVAPTSASGVPTNIPPATLTFALTLTPSGIPTRTSISTSETQLATSTGSTAVLPATLIPLTPQAPTEIFLTPSAGATPTLAPIQPKFLTLGQRISAVNNDLRQNENLISFVSSIDAAGYPNLESLGLLIVPTPTVLAALPSRTAASPSTEIVASPSDKVQIRWFCCLGTGDQDIQKTIEEEVVTDFNASQDRIELVLEIVPYESARDALATQIASGNGPDIVGPVGWTGSNYFYGQWIDLAPYIEKYGFDLSIFDPALISYYLTEEGQVALPFDVFPGALYYVPAMFDEAGLNYPPQIYGEKYVMPDGTEVDWNWDTLTEIAKLLTVDVSGLNSTETGFDPTEITQVGYSPQWQSVLAIGTFYDGAAKIYSGDAKGSYESTIPAGWKEAFLWYYDGMWGEQPFIATGPLSGAPEFGNGNVFNSGKAAMALTQSWYTCCLGDFRDAGNEFQLAVQPIGADGIVNGRIDADTFRIWKGTSHPDEAFEVLSYLITIGADKLLPIYGAMPAISSKADTYLESKSNDYPFVTQESWNIFVQGLSYPDTPSSEQYQPNGEEAFIRQQAFMDLMNNTPPDQFDFETEFQKLVEDLNIIYNQ